MAFGLLASGVQALFPRAPDAEIIVAHIGSCGEFRVLVPDGGALSLDDEDLLFCGGFKRGFSIRLILCSCSSLSCCGIQVFHDVSWFVGLCDVHGSKLSMFSGTGTLMGFLLRCGLVVWPSNLCSPWSVISVIIKTCEISPDCG